MHQNRWHHRPKLWSLYNFPKDTLADLAGIEICIVRKFLDPPLGEVIDFRFNYIHQIARPQVRIFKKFLVQGAHRAPSPDPSPAQSQASPSIRASPSILGRFAPLVRALPLILLGRFAPSVRASPSIHPQNMLIPLQHSGTR